MLDLGETPAIRLLTGLVAALLGLSQLSSLVGLAPFWADLLGGVVLLVTAASLGRERHALTRARQQAGFKPGGGYVSTMAVVTSTCGAVIFAVLGVWVAARPVTHLTRGAWQLCGTFQTACGDRACLRFQDALGRQVGNTCIAPDDDTGFKNLRPLNWWDYRPTSVALSCGTAAPSSTTVPGQAFSGSCEALIPAR